MKACTLCRKEFPETLDFFNKKSSSFDSLQNVCKICCAERSRKHYVNNTETVKQRTKARKDKIKHLAQKIVLDALKSGCIDCGELDIVVLDFDHQGNKKYNIANMLHDAASLDKLKQEIDKCEVRCANCHRRKTAKDQGWWRLTMNNSA